MLDPIAKTVGMQSFLEWKEYEHEEQEKYDEDTHHGVKNFFASKPIGDASKDKSKQERHWHDGPDLQKWQSFCARRRCSDDERIFGRAQKTVIETDEKKDQEQGDELFQFMRVDWP